jgi:sigma-B regulation protein RsbU (phosphoserine phosphatase)
MTEHLPTIAFIDDDPRVRGILADALRRAGFRVLEGASGADALRLAREATLVILDVQLPDMTGVDVCRRLKDDPATCSVLVLHLSGQFMSSEDRIHGLESGADGYLLKPVSLGELVAHVRALLRIRRAEEARDVSEARLQDILDNAPAVVHVKDIDGRYLLVNRRWEERFHRQRREVVGRRPHEVFPHEQADLFLANDRKVLEAGTALTFEEVAQHDDGPHTYLSSKFPLPNGSSAHYAVCGISTDITDRKRAEEALRDSEALYHSLVETLPVCIMRKDVHGRFTFANQAFCADIGRTLEQVVGGTDQDLYPPELVEKYRRDDRYVRETGEVFEDVEEHVSIIGNKRYVKVLKAPVRDARGRVIGVQGLFWDITERKQGEEEMARTAAEFRVARRIQQRLFPTQTPRLAGLDIGSATYRFDIGGASFPAEAIGGDYYDYVGLPDGSLGIAVGDVSGHGVGPALLMAEARAYLRGSAQVEADVSAILERVNRLLVQDIQGDHFITMLLARLAPDGRSLVYASAGHATGYLFDAAGTVKASMPSTAVPLGIEPDSEFPAGEVIRLEPGDIVLFLTDGVVEARDPEGGVFGTKRALDVVRFYRDRPAQQIVDNLYHAVRAFSRNEPQVDDITATIIKVGARG